MSTVLLVEDDKLLGKALSGYLEKAGLELFWARNGNEVFEALESQNVALILLDIMMPEMDGFEVLKKLKGDAETADIPVIVLSNLSSSEDMEKAKSLGAEDYIIKSNIEFEELVRIVKEKVY